MGTAQEPVLRFADLLRRYRVAAGLSQEALAERAGLSARAISDLERGARRSPYRETVRMLADALGLTREGQETLEAAVNRVRGARPTSEPPPGTGNLPVPVTTLIGREVELATVKAKFRTERARLITLTGPPGIGKTRLALEIARELISEWPDGVFFVELAPLKDPRAVATSILQSLGLSEDGERPAADRLKHVLRGKHAIILLDNFEHVIEASPLIGEILEAAPGLVVLATSRVVLKLRGEQEFPVSPLAVLNVRSDSVHIGSLTAVGDLAAVMLFVERARSVRPGFSLTEENAIAISEICRRLDGLPLAIELAAARCKVLSPEAMLQRLSLGLDLLAGGARDAPARHRTLRAAIVWSIDLLAPEEQALFRRLGVFAGGCSLEDAKRVCAFDLNTEVFDVISALVDKSLVQVIDGQDGEPRFSMLETLREFALEELNASGERAEVQRRHAEGVRDVAEKAARHLYGGERDLWLRRLNEEQHNIRAALGWSRDQSEPTLGLIILDALWLWLQRRLLVEGRRWADELLAHPGAARQTISRANALFLAGHLSWLQGDIRAMRSRLDEAVAIQRQLGDEVGLCRSLPFLGVAARDLPTARSLAKEGVQLSRQVGGSWILALALLNLGRIEATWGSDPAASAPLEEAAEIFGTLGDRWLRALTLTSIGAIAFRHERIDQAKAAFEEALTCFRAVEDRRNTAQALTNLGYALLASGDRDAAREHFTESLAFGLEHGDRFNTPASIRGLAILDLNGSKTDLAKVARLLSAADALTGVTEAARWPAERLGGPVSTQELRDSLGEDMFAKVWAEGASLSVKDAVAAAVSKFQVT